MAAGKPVVASRVAGLMDIVSDLETGILVAPGDKVGLARQTRLLLDDPKRGQLLGEAGRHRAAKFFSVQSMTHAYISLYESVSKPG
jgi:glycosyltransferase involved in cell wall biosynthesis